MKKTTDGFQELTEGNHYFLPRTLFPSLQQALRAGSDQKPMRYETLKFSDLLDVYNAEHPDPRDQKIARSVLLRYLGSNELTLEDSVGRVFRSDFYPRRRKYRGERTESGKAKGTVANECAILSRFYKLTARLDLALSSANGELSPFQKQLIQLRDAVGDILVMARETSVPKTILEGWIAGKAPGSRSGRLISRIENYFGMSRGQLQSCAPRVVRKHWSRRGGALYKKEVGPSKFGQRLARGRRDPVAIKPRDFPEEFRIEFQALCMFKTDMLGDGPVSTGKIGRLWVTHTLEGRSIHPDDHFWTVVRNRWCPSAGSMLYAIALYLGWLARPKERGGAGLGLGFRPSLAYVTDHSLVKQCLDWIINDRNGGVVNGQVVRLLAQICSLVIPVHGFVWRNPSNILKQPYEEVEWRKRCEEAYTKYKRIRVELNKRVRMTRDPFERIRSIIERDDPMQAVWDALDRMERDRPYPGGEAECIWYRNYILLSLSASCPLRARNFQELTWRPDGSGHLRKRSDGGYQIWISGKEMKNHYGYAKDFDYDYPVQPRLTPYLDTYLTKILPKLAKGKTDRIFVGTGDPERIWKNLSDEFANVTATYFSDTPGFRIHAMRHIVATALVKETGGFVAAALALHDMEETVRKHYGRFQVRDAARWMKKIWDRRDN
jgi:integrase